MDGRVEVFPYQGVMLHIPVQEKGHQMVQGPSDRIGKSTNLMKFCWVTLPVLRQRIPQTDTIPIFSIARRRFWKKYIFKSAHGQLKLALNEMRQRQTPDLSVDLISSSRWSRITSLMNSYLSTSLCKLLNTWKVLPLTRQESLLSLQSFLLGLLPCKVSEMKRYFLINLNTLSFKS